MEKGNSSTQTISSINTLQLFYKLLFANKNDFSLQLGDLCLCYVLSSIV